MPPSPKHPSRQTRPGRGTTAATLAIVTDREAPELPLREVYDTDIDSATYSELVTIPWHPRTLDWWATAWASPMAGEWLDADVPGLVLVAELWDAFYGATSTSERLKLSAELRLQEARFGLAPMDRRRLQWEVERTEDAKDRGAKRRRTTAPAEGASAPKTDPRAALAAVE